MPVEELAKRARQVRDALDPRGAEERFARRFDDRSFRIWTDSDGGRHARFDFDDEIAAWVEAVVNAAMRPRRGGPRFMTDEERSAARELSEDPRTNDQLAYDLMVGLLRAGAVADAADVFGARQPGVRIVVQEAAAADGRGRSRDAEGSPTGYVEDGGEALAGSIVERNICAVGSVQVTVDSCGNPLDVGREQRLFTPKQRIAMAIRDGGCRWPGCTAVASYCESHHIDHWHADHGRTDIDRGILLCRFHHMSLHNNGWTIRSRDRGVFTLHAPNERGDGSPFDMPSRSPLRWEWDPPPARNSWRKRQSA
jgi:hypothetical protein